jgi:hypothetical protein
MHRRQWLQGAIACASMTASTAHANWLQQQSSSFLKSLTGSSDLANDEIVAGLKEALKVGTSTVTTQLGSRNGFNGDPAVHIPLPNTLKRVRSALSPFGLAGMLDDLELRLNRAAEDATPKAKQVFWDAIGAMSWDDARKIYAGPDNAATEYFRDKMSPPLAQEWEPIVSRSLADVGAVKAYDQAIGEYAKLPFVPDAKANLTTYVIEQGLRGVFHYLAKEEAAIRNNPVKRSTELLERVFGG